MSSSKIPPGIPFIVGNEAAERFSYYGMRAILTIFMTQHLRNAAGELDCLSEDEAKAAYHLFSSAAYFFPLLGALLADVLWGKYRTIIALSLVYCLGHLALAVDSTRWGLTLGLILIAVGAGGIKPCVSAHVGDQFGEQNRHLMERVFGWFYLAINIGAFISSLLTPNLLVWYGPEVAFGLPGVLMFAATAIFWSGRRRFVHIPPGGRKFLDEILSREGLRAIGRLSVLYVFVAVFWSLYDQTGSAWVLQANRMHRALLGRTWLPDEVQAINPALILLLVPLFSKVIYPIAGRFVTLTPLRKIGAGFFLMTFTFALTAQIETWIAGGRPTSIVWQAIAYVPLTAAEVLVSVTCLEFSYTQAPPRMKSFIMSLYMLSVSAGNLLTSAVNWFIANPDGSSKLSGPEYYWFFTGLMGVAACLFVIASQFYRGQTYLQKAEVEEGRRMKAEG